MVGLYLIFLINNLCFHFTAIFALLKGQKNFAEDINIKMNENISLTWIVYGKNIPNNYDIIVEMDDEDISSKTQKYSLNTSNIDGKIALANFEMNSTEVEVDTHQFVMCAVFKTGELAAKNYCTSSSVQVFSDCAIQGRGLLIVCAWTLL